MGRPTDPLGLVRDFGLSKKKKTLVQIVFLCQKGVPVMDNCYQVTGLIS